MAEIKQAKFIDQTGQEKDAVFIGAEKAIYDDSGKRLDQKLEERKKASGLLATDTQGILGGAGTEVSLQAIIDKVAEKITNELVSNSSLAQTLANYVTKAMMSNVQVNDQNKVPTSALAYAMQQAIAANANGVTQLNNNFKARDASLEIGQVEQGAYVYLRNKVTNNLLMLRLNEDDKKLVFNSEVDGQWGTETELVTKSDLPNMYYKIGSTATNNPLETIKQNWNDMPDGYYLCEISCGSSYIGIVQRISNGKHGSVLVNGYGDNTPIYVKRLDGMWK